MSDDEEARKARAARLQKQIDDRIAGKDSHSESPREMTDKAAAEQKAATRCQAINHPNLQPGWGCCQCRTYNGDQRQQCKRCGHTRCDIPHDEEIN